jgi:hypothetical protein
LSRVHNPLLPPGAPSCKVKSSLWTSRPLIPTSSPLDTVYITGRARRVNACPGQEPLPGATRERDLLTAAFSQRCQVLYGKDATAARHPHVQVT